MWSDTELQVHVEKELAWEPSVHSNQMAVVVKDGALQLVGHADTYWEKCAAERAAWRVAHVKSVKNELRVQLPFDALRGDDDIALAAMGNLEWNCLVPDSVEVRVVDRGPAKGPRAEGVVIDLSSGAASHLDFIQQGRTRVRLEVLRWGH